MVPLISDGRGPQSLKMSAKKPVVLFYDVISPYTWIAFEVLCRYRAKWMIDLQFKPFFLGGIMKGSDNRPPGVVPSKAQYLMQDIARLAKHFSVPIKHPSNPAEVMFVKGSLSTMRFLTAVDSLHPEHTEALSRELWMRVWNRDQDIVDPASLAEAGKSIGLSDAVINDAISKMKDPAIKDMLKANTDAALQHGAFGSPTIIVEDDEKKTQMVFGSDRFHILADILGEKYEGPLTELASSKL